jgi:hypothetical protein
VLLWGCYYDPGCYEHYNWAKEEGIYNIRNALHWKLINNQEAAKGMEDNRKLQRTKRQLGSPYGGARRPTRPRKSLKKGDDKKLEMLYIGN